MRKSFITEISVENFRCFATKQDVPIAPLTFLVGENSTGKTSFLALTRILCETAFRQRMPVFNEIPFDLGGFDEVAFNDNSDETTPTIRAGLAISENELKKRSEASDTFELCEPSQVWKFEGSFDKHGAVPKVSKLRFSQARLSIELRFKDGSLDEITLTSATGRQAHVSGEALDSFFKRSATFSFLPLESCIARIRSTQDEEDLISNEEFWTEFRDFLLESPFGSMFEEETTTYASSPVRSRPERTYHATNSSFDPEGHFVPFLLSNIQTQDPRKWKHTSKEIEELGKSTGLFDSIEIKRSQDLDGAPFQIHVGVPGCPSSESRGRSLVDVGYGVSQALPILVSLLTEESSSITLLQQPEIHLHPKAQAALGDLFCGWVQMDLRQLLVETHSDYLIERVRILVREGVMDPSFVVVLFFERSERGVRIYPIRFDELGNVLDAPTSYRSFFLQEMDRSLGMT